MFLDLDSIVYTTPSEYIGDEFSDFMPRQAVTSASSVTHRNFVPGMNLLLTIFMFAMLITRKFT